MMGPPSRASVTRSSLRLRFSCAARFAEGCSTRGVHASPSPSRTRVASLWALPKAVPVAVAVAVKVAVAVAARDGGGAMRSAKPASVGRTRSGCWKGPITTELGPGDGRGGSVTAARATSSTALARRIAGVGATILRRGGGGGRGGGQRAPGRGRTGVPPGGGFRGTGRGDGFGGKGRRTWPFDVRARSLEPFVRHARREGGRTRRRARRCARSTRPARSRFSRQKSAAPRLRESMRMRTATLSNKGVFVLETSSESARVRRLRLTSERRVVSRVGDRPLGDARDTGPRAAETM